MNSEDSYGQECLLRKLTQPGVRSFWTDVSCLEFECKKHKTPARHMSAICHRIRPLSLIKVGGHCRQIALARTQLTVESEYVQEEV